MVQVRFYNGESFDYSSDENVMRKEIEKFSKDDLKGLPQISKDFTQKIFEKGFIELLSDKPFNKLNFMIKQIPSLLKLKSYQSVYSLVSNYIKNEKLRRVFSMHPLLVGGNPFTTTSIYAFNTLSREKMGNTLRYGNYWKYS